MDQYPKVAVMSFFPVLEKKALLELIAMFAAHPGDHGIAPEETELFFDELAIQIAETGKNGATFLLNSLPQADGQRVQGILAGLAFVDKDSCKELLPQIKSTLAFYLAGANADLVAEAVESANKLSRRGSLG